MLPFCSCPKGPMRVIPEPPAVVSSLAQKTLPFASVVNFPPLTKPAQLKLDMVKPPLEILRPVPPTKRPPLIVVVALPVTARNVVVALVALNVVVKRSVELAVVAKKEVVVAATATTPPAELTEKRLLPELF